MPKRLAIALAVGLLIAVTVLPARALGCGAEAGVPLDDGCLFTITGSDTPDPADGFAVTNSNGVPLWDFVRARDLQAIGYPISQRWVDGPFTLQAFQKVILQWDPGTGQMNYYNTLDVLANWYPHVNLPNVPVHEVLAADFGADFATVTQNHLAILDRNPKIKSRFLAEPDWLNLYGLPIRYEAREVNGNAEGLQVLRTQRTVFVVWNVPAPGTTVGQVLLQNVPDKVKTLSNVIIPDAAEAPIGPEAVEGLPRFTLTDQPAPPRSDRPTSLEGCAGGAVVPSPGLHPELVKDCLILLQVRDVLVADGSLNWTASRPIAEWQGIGVGGSPRRVQSLSISGGERGGLIPGRNRRSDWAAYASNPRQCFNWRDSVPSWTFGKSASAGPLQQPTDRNATLTDRTLGQSAAPQPGLQSTFGFDSP